MVKTKKLSILYSTEEQDEVLVPKIKLRREYLGDHFPCMNNERNTARVF